MADLDSLVRLLARQQASILTFLSKGSPTSVHLEAMASTNSDQESRLAYRRLSELTGNDPSLAPLIQGIAIGLLDGQRSGERPTIVVSAPIENQHRETAGVLASLISASQRSVTFCSFIVAYVNELIPLVESAYQRGVLFRGIVDKTSLEGMPGKAALRAISIAAPNAELWVWDGDDIESTLHAKFLVADGQSLWLSSANLTGRAITNNVELGALLEDNGVAQEAELFFEALIASSQAATLQTMLAQLGE